MIFKSFYSCHDSVRLVPRNEGKIKSIDSCHDLRAWSHDITRRDHYIREWMKCDMPIYIIPPRVIISMIRRMMGCGKGVPRCHPQCKSKAVLESICNSYYAMRECLKSDNGFNKYFEDEEFETSGWPCEKCLDALKGIKMLWKIIVGKLLNFYSSDSLGRRYPQEESYCTDSVRSVAKLWQNNMLHETTYLKSHIPHSINCPQNRRKTMSTEVKSSNFPYYGLSPFNRNASLEKNNCTRSKSWPCTMMDTKELSNPSGCSCEEIFLCSNDSNISRPCPKKSNIHDFSSDSSHLPDETNAYKASYNGLKEKFNIQKLEIERLKRENGCLKTQLRKLWENASSKCSYSTPCSRVTNKNVQEKLPKPYEVCANGKNTVLKSIEPLDSEMIITLKNCKNESYRHISLLQVIHKTNTPILYNLNSDGTGCCEKENPMAILAKVQDTFGAIVDREISLANKKRCYGNKFDIDASYHKGNASTSSCSSMPILPHSVTRSVCNDILKIDAISSVTSENKKTI